MARTFPTPDEIEAELLRRQAGSYESPCDVPHDERVRRALAYAMQVPGAISEQRGHDATFALAMKLIHGFDLAPHEAMTVMRQWNTNCQPPGSECELKHKVEDANRKPGERGSKLMPRQRRKTHRRFELVPA